MGRTPPTVGLRFLRVALALADPAFREAFAKTGAPVEALQYGDRATCTRYAKGMVELANEYRSLLTAKKGK